MRKRQAVRLLDVFIEILPPSLFTGRYKFAVLFFVSPLSKKKVTKVTDKISYLSRIDIAGLPSAVLAEESRTYLLKYEVSPLVDIKTMITDLTTVLLSSNIKGQVSYLNKVLPLESYVEIKKINQEKNNEPTRKAPVSSQQLPS